MTQTLEEKVREQISKSFDAQHRKSSFAVGSIEHLNELTQAILAAIEQERGDATATIKPMSWTRTPLITTEEWMGDAGSFGQYYVTLDPDGWVWSAPDWPEGHDTGEDAERCKSKEDGFYLAQSHLTARIAEWLTTPPSQVTPPREPTEAMVKAFHDQIERDLGAAFPRKIYRAMIEAWEKENE